MRRMVIGLLVGAAAAVVAAGPAGAQTPTTPTTGPTVSTPTPPASGVAAAIADAGWYADGGAVGDREQLADVAERLASEGHHLGFALLASEPPGDSTAFAEQVLDALPGLGERTIRTVVVLSDADVGAVSDVWGDDAIDAALDDTIDDVRADPTDGLEALADALADQPTGTDTGDDGGNGGGASGGWLALGVIALVALSLGSRLFRGAGSGDAYDDPDDGGSSWRRRRYRSSGRRSFSSGGRSRRRSSSGGRRRGRGGRRL